MKAPTLKVPVEVEVTYTTHRRRGDIVLLWLAALTSVAVGAFLMITHGPREIIYLSGVLAGVSSTAAAALR